MSVHSPGPARVIGRYALYAEIAFGGMATVHIGRLQGPAGFARTVAIKRLHPQFARDPEFVSMALDEARLAARIQHPNVVSVLDVVSLDGELFLVMDYIHGEALSKLIRASREDSSSGVPPRIAASLVAGALHGLHAAHEAKTERGTALGIVHRDVSPQNILVGADGVARVVDFGVAKAANRIQSTHEGQLKGKLCYMSPEQLHRGAVDRRTDIYAAAVVLWEALTGTRMIQAEEPGAVVTEILYGSRVAPGSVAPGIPAELDDIVMRGLSADPRHRFGTAREMALALEDTLPLAPASHIGDWVEELASDTLRRRADLVAEIECASCPSVPAPGLRQSQAQSESATARERAPERPVSTFQQHSQVSSLSVTTPMATIPPRRGTRGVIAGAAVLAVAVPVALFVGFSSGRPIPAAPPEASVASPSGSPSLAQSTADQAGQPSLPPSAPSAPAAPASAAASSRTRPVAPRGATTTGKRVHDFGF